MEVLERSESELQRKEYVLKYDHSQKNGLIQYVDKTINSTYNVCLKTVTLFLICFSD